MPEAGYQEAVQLLIEHLGRQWQGLEADGRDEMERVLRDKLGYDRKRAHETINTMIDIGTLRYHTAAAERAGNEHIIPPVMLSGTTSAGMGGPALSAAAADGYWQIGHETDDEPGRAGQVRTS